jgi:hypothetical protein
MVIWRAHRPWYVFLLHLLPLFVFILFILTVATGIVGIFIPFSRTMDLIYAIGGCLIFSGYIVYDTFMINRRLSPDEFIMGAISLYLEYVSSATNTRGSLLTLYYVPASSIFVSVAHRLI